MITADVKEAIEAVEYNQDIQENRDLVNFLDTKGFVEIFF